MNGAFSTGFSAGFDIGDDDGGPITPEPPVTVPVSGSTGYRYDGSDVVKHTFSWESDASGNATIASSRPVSGQIHRVIIVPSASAVPTALYDVTLTDENKVDVLAGQGANASDTLANSFCPGSQLKDSVTVGTRRMVVDSILTLNVSNAGNATAGKVVVYVR